MRLMNTFLSSLFLFALSSCEKVIDIKLKGSDTKYVIEAIVTNERGKSSVRISETKHFAADNEFPGVTGAVVKIRDNGTEFTFTETRAGVYENSILNGKPGHTYDLSVAINNQLFSATCTMPQPVFIDTLYISNGPLGRFRFATVRYSDPAGINNSYRFVQYLNGTKDPTIFWENDEFTDGQTIIAQLDTEVSEIDDPRNIKSGDEVTVELLSLEEAVYRYWSSLRSGGGDGESSVAAPANPPTNIRGGALGYFSAHWTHRKTVIAP